MAEMDPAPRDQRFHYDIIKGLWESTRSLTENLMEQQKTLAEIVQRLARIEANEVNSRVKALEAAVEELKAERDQRAGMARLLDWTFKSPLVGWLAGAAAATWLLLSGKGAQ